MHSKLALLYYAFLIISSCNSLKPNYGVWSQKYFKSSSYLR